MNVRDSAQTIIGFTAVIAMLTIALAKTTQVMMLAAVLGLFSTLGIASLTSFLSKLVPSGEIGKILGFYGVCAALSTILSNIIVNGVYALTVVFWPGLSFILIAGLVALSCLRMLVVRTFGG